MVWMCVSFDFGKTSNSIIWDFYFYTYSRTRLVKQFSCSNELRIKHEIIVYGVFFITKYQALVEYPKKRTLYLIKRIISEKFTQKWQLNNIQYHSQCGTQIKTNFRYYVWFQYWTTMCYTPKSFTPKHCCQTT